MYSIEQLIAIELGIYSAKLDNCIVSRLCQIGERAVLKDCELETAYRVPADGEYSHTTMLLLQTHIYAVSQSQGRETRIII